MGEMQGRRLAFQQEEDVDNAASLFYTSASIEVWPKLNPSW